MIIINFGTTENMDKEIIPEVIYTLTINKNTINIQDYFIKHIPLLYSFVGFNGALKLANQLNVNKKCGCYYILPWKTHYAEMNDTIKTSLLFIQQVDLYTYMIKNSNTSYMKYLSGIALQMVLNINLYLYYITNNKDPCFIFREKWYKDNFTNENTFRTYIRLNMQYINPRQQYSNL